jgi:hypothetical protein
MACFVAFHMISKHYLRFWPTSLLRWTFTNSEHLTCPSHRMALTAQACLHSFGLLLGMKLLGSCLVLWRFETLRSILANKLTSVDLDQLGASYLSLSYDGSSLSHCVWLIVGYESVWFMACFVAFRTREILHSIWADVLTSVYLYRL